MDRTFKTEGVVDGTDRIRTDTLPLPDGQRVELTVRPIKAGANKVRSAKAASGAKLAAIEELLAWNVKHLPKHLPALNDSAVSRESIY